MGSILMSPDFWMVPGPHSESLKCLRHKRSLFWGSFQIMLPFRKSLRWLFFTRQKLLFGGSGVDGFTEDSEQRASPSHWGDRWKEGRCEMESFQHFLVHMNIFFHFFFYILLKPKKMSAISLWPVFPLYLSVTNILSPSKILEYGIRNVEKMLN